MDKSALLAELDADETQHITFLQQFLQAPSPNPPGDTRAAANVVLSYLESHGITPEIIAPQEHMPNIVSDFVGGRSPHVKAPRLILNGHIDVFPSGPESDWTVGRGPWSGYVDEKERRIYGRGACDMKTGTAASIITYAYFHKYRDQLSGNLGLTVVSDEETGGKWVAGICLMRLWAGDT